MRREKVGRISAPGHDQTLLEAETSANGTFSSTTTISIFDKFPRNQLPETSSSIIQSDLPSPIPTAFLHTFSIQHSPILEEFPYRSSVLVSDLDGEKFLPVSVRNRRRSRAEEIIWKGEAEGRSSSEVDLNLSFELDREIRARSTFKSDHVEITMPRAEKQKARESFDSSESGHGSGILPFGTFSGVVLPPRPIIVKKEGAGKKKMRPGLREIYTAGEIISRESEGDDEWEAAVRAQSPALAGSISGVEGDRTDWIRRNNHLEDNRPITRSSFVFNALDVPLPTSPVEADFDTVSESSPQKSLPLPPKKRPFPLKLVLDRAKKVGSPVSSPNWSMGTYLNSPSTTLNSPQLGSAAGLGMGTVTEGVLYEYEVDMPLQTKSEPILQKQFSKKPRTSWNGIKLGGILTSLKIGSDTVSSKGSPLFDRDEAITSPESDFTFNSPRSEDFRARELGETMGIAGLDGLGLSIEETSSPIRGKRMRSHLPSSLSMPIPVSPTLSSNPPSPAFYASPSNSNRYSRIISPTYPLSPGLPSPQFSFRPHPLTLVSLLPPPTHARHASTSTSSSIQILPFKKLKSLDQLPPSELLFYLGFLLGPWFWFYGAFLLRPDGEKFGEIGKRCACGCGKIIRSPRGTAGILGGSEGGKGEKYLIYCRVASGIFGGIVTPLIGLAIWAALVY